MCSAPRLSVNPSSSSIPTRYIHAAEPGVPGPAAAAGVRGVRVHVGGDDVGLRAVARDVLRRARLVRRVQHREQLHRRDRRRRAARTPARSRAPRACTVRRSPARPARSPGCSPGVGTMRSNGGVSSSTRPSSRRTRCVSTDSIAWRARAGSPAPEITAHDCAIASIRHSAFSRDPSGVPSSKYARRYHSPSQASSTLAVRRVGVRAILRGARRVAPGVGQRGERRQDREQEPGEPHAFAAALGARPGSCRRSSRRCRSAAGRAARSRG